MSYITLLAEATYGRQALAINYDNHTYTTYNQAGCYNDVYGIATFAKNKKALTILEKQLDGAGFEKQNEGVFYKVYRKQK